jgi:hypothetical protein
MLCFLLFVNRSVAQCNFKIRKREPDYKFIEKLIGPSTVQWPFALGSNEEGRRFLWIQVQPGFVTVSEPFKRKHPMTPKDSLVLMFGDKKTISLYPNKDVNAVYESVGGVMAWCYNLRFEIGVDVLEKLANETLVAVVVNINGQQRGREVKKRQQKAVQEAAKCNLK